MKRNFIFISIALLLGATVWAVTLTPGMQKLIQAQWAINNHYVDTVNDDKLVEDAIKGMLEGLDPHSSYSTPEETRELQEPLEGNFSGIGITFNMNKDTLYVIQTVSGGPSERVGILAGDRIIAVNDSSIAGQKMKNSAIMKKLRGPKGTKVNVTVLRRANGTDEEIPFTITRADIPIKSVDAAYMADPKTGYIRLNKFGADTPEEFYNAIKKLQEQGMEQLILDLTDNGGGYMEAAINVASEMLSPYSLVVFTEGENQSRKDFYSRAKNGLPQLGTGRLVVMMNQYSASASEITAGAVQDHDRGVVVGRRSFGKGLVQRPIPFSDGSMMRLTVAHYYTPSGRDIQKPYTKGDQDSYDKDIVNRFDNGELMHADSVHFDESKRVNTLSAHRTVYGGGGIYPDVFVPLDTTEYSKYYRNVMAKGLINQFAISYIDKHRKDLKKRYTTDEEYVDQFVVTDDMLGTLREMADKEKIEFNAEQFEVSTPLFKMLIKALIGRDVYEDDTFYKVFNQHDPIFLKALEVINSDTYDSLLAPPEIEACGIFDNL